MKARQAIRMLENWCHPDDDIYFFFLNKFNTDYKLKERFKMIEEPIKDKEWSMIVKKLERSDMPIEIDNSLMYKIKEIIDDKVTSS
tara:strand:- start:1740 stop:1997 length:258 start_codon:yes stop_codon:yes gene_type:complete